MRMTTTVTLIDGTELEGKVLPFDRIGYHREHGHPLGKAEESGVDPEQAFLWVAWHALIKRGRKVELTFDEFLEQVEEYTVDTGEDDLDGEDPPTTPTSD